MLFGLTSQCFTGDTLVSTEDGLSPIEEIQIGDYIWAEDITTEEKKLKRVTNISVTMTNLLVYVTTEDGTTIRTTENHPFYVENKGWVVAVNIEKGDILHSKEGQIEIVTDVVVEKQEKPSKVYNLTIEDYHTYYVSENSVLVHNDGCTVNYNGEDVPVYRGGDDFTLDPKEIKIDPVTGNVKRTHGVSVNIDPRKLERFGGAYEITSLPEELVIIQRGRDPGHFEIVPNVDMIKSVFQELLNKIKTKKYGE